jgi:hypothetical protein
MVEPPQVKSAYGGENDQRDQTIHAVHDSLLPGRHRANIEQSWTVLSTSFSEPLYRHMA